MCCDKVGVVYRKIALFGERPSPYYYYIFFGTHLLIQGYITTKRCTLQTGRVKGHVLCTGRCLSVHRPAHTPHLSPQCKLWLSICTLGAWRPKWGEIRKEGWHRDSGMKEKQSRLLSMPLEGRVDLHPSLSLCNVYTFSTFHMSRCRLCMRWNGKEAVDLKLQFGARGSAEIEGAGGFQKRPSEWHSGLWHYYSLGFDPRLCHNQPWPGVP